MHSIEMEFNQCNKPVILLAEDDPDQSDSLRESLALEGFKVETVFSGDMALRKLTEHTYAAAIMDLRMPGLNGGTVLKICRVKQNPIRIPIIIVSAFASPLELKKYEECGASASFSKPLDFQKLLTRLNQLVPREKLQR